MGSIVPDGDRAVVEFERTIDAVIDTVWDLIATGDGLAKWLAPSTVDLRIGGELDIDFGEDGLAGGLIIDLVPGQVLEYHWMFPGEPDSILRLELEDLGDSTRVRLRHRLLPHDQSVGYGAGWHAHLDQLAAVAGGEDQFDWTARFSELLPAYES
jgi:uncharacterized protein YndB with AHSA1/START domain